MTDRELLEAAAKAAGYDVEWQAGLETGWMVGGSWWNPLTDDGDAQRLAVALGLAVSVEYQFGSTAVLWGPPIGNIREQHGTDPYAATRRAIVRAAAEIGKSMPQPTLAADLPEDNYYKTEAEAFGYGRAK